MLSSRLVMRDVDGRVFFRRYASRGVVGMSKCNNMQQCMSVYALYKLCILEDAFIVEPALIVAAALTIQQGFAPD